MESKLNLNNIKKACESQADKVDCRCQNHMEYNQYMEIKEETAGGQPMDYSTHYM